MSTGTLTRPFPACFSHRPPSLGPDLPADDRVQRAYSSLPGPGSSRSSASPARSVDSCCAATVLDTSDAWRRKQLEIQHLQTKAKAIQSQLRQGSARSSQSTSSAVDGSEFPSSRSNATEPVTYGSGTLNGSFKDPTDSSRSACSSQLSTYQSCFESAGSLQELSVLQESNRVLTEDHASYASQVAALQYACLDAERKLEANHAIIKAGSEARQSLELSKEQEAELTAKVAKLQREHVLFGRLQWADDAVYRMMHDFVEGDLMALCAERRNAEAVLRAELQRWREKAAKVDMGCPYAQGLRITLQDLQDSLTKFMIVSRRELEHEEHRLQTAGAHALKEATELCDTEHEEALEEQKMAQQLAAKEHRIATQHCVDLEQLCWVQDTSELRSKSLQTLQCLLEDTTASCMALQKSYGALEADTAQLREQLQGFQTVAAAERRHLQERTAQDAAAAAEERKRLRRPLSQRIVDLQEQNVELESHVNDATAKLKDSQIEFQARAAKAQKDSARTEKRLRQELENMRAELSTVSKVYVEDQEFEAQTRIDLMAEVEEADDKAMIMVEKAKAIYNAAQSQEETLHKKYKELVATSEAAQLHQVSELNELQANNEALEALQTVGFCIEATSISTEMCDVKRVAEVARCQTLAKSAAAVKFCRDEFRHALDASNVEAELALSKLKGECKKHDEVMSQKVHSLEEEISSTLQARRHTIAERDIELEATRQELSMAEERTAVLKQERDAARLKHARLHDALDEDSRQAATPPSPFTCEVTQREPHHEVSKGNLYISDEFYNSNLVASKFCSTSASVCCAPTTKARAGNSYPMRSTSSCFLALATSTPSFAKGRDEQSSLIKFQQFGERLMQSLHNNRQFLEESQIKGEQIHVFSDLCDSARDEQHEPEEELQTARHDIRKLTDLLLAAQQSLQKALQDNGSRNMALQYNNALQANKEGLSSMRVELQQELDIARVELANATEGAMSCEASNKCFDQELTTAMSEASDERAESELAAETLTAELLQIRAEATRDVAIKADAREEQRYFLASELDMFERRHLSLREEVEDAEEANGLAGTEAKLFAEEIEAMEAQVQEGQDRLQCTLQGMGRHLRKEACCANENVQRIEARESDLQKELMQRTCAEQQLEEQVRTGGRWGERQCKWEQDLKLRCTKLNGQRKKLENEVAVEKRRNDQEILDFRKTLLEEVRAEEMAHELNSCVARQLEEAEGATLAKCNELQSEILLEQSGIAQLQAQYWETLEQSCAEAEKEQSSYWENELASMESSYSCIPLQEEGHAEGLIASELSESNESLQRWIQTVSEETIEANQIFETGMVQIHDGLQYLSEAHQEELQACHSSSVLDTIPMFLSVLTQQLVHLERDNRTLEESIETLSQNAKKLRCPLLEKPHQATSKANLQMERLRCEQNVSDTMAMGQTELRKLRDGNKKLRDDTVKLQDRIRIISTPQAKQKDQGLSDEDWRNSVHAAATASRRQSRIQAKHKLEEAEAELAKIQEEAVWLEQDLLDREGLRAMEIERLKDAGWQATSLQEELDKHISFKVQFVEQRVMFLEAECERSHEMECELQTQRDCAERQLAVAAAQLNDLLANGSQQDMLRQDLAMLMAQFEELQRQQRAHSAKTHGTEQLLLEHEQHKNLLEDELAAATKKMNAFEEQETSNHERQVASLQEVSQELRKRCGEAERELVELQAEQTKLSSEACVCRDRSHKEQLQVVELESDAAKLQSELQQEEREVAENPNPQSPELEKALVQCEDELKTSLQKLQDLRAAQEDDLQKLVQRADDAEKQRDAATGRVSCLELEIKSFQSQCLNSDSGKVHGESSAQHFSETQLSEEEFQYFVHSLGNVEDIESLWQEVLRVQKHAGIATIQECSAQREVRKAETLCVKDWLSSPHRPGKPTDSTKSDDVDSAPVSQLTELQVQAQADLAREAFQRARAHLEQLNFSHAVPVLQQALQGLYGCTQEGDVLDDRSLAPKLQIVAGDIWAHLGVAMQSLDRVPEAMQNYQRAISLDPSLHVCHANLAALYAFAGDRFKALQSIETALNLDKGNPAYGSIRRQLDADQPVGNECAVAQRNEIVGGTTRNYYAQRACCDEKSEAAQ